MSSRTNRRAPLAAALSVASLVLAPSIALAEVERPSQGEASDGLFLSYAPRPDDRGAVCFVDSGIDENPDTEDGIIERTSVAGDGSSGEDGDTDERHGTSMAMVAGAPRNGWGMVGAWSHLKLVGVRASDKGEDNFPFERYRTGIEKCRELRQDGRPIKVILLALGASSDPNDTARKLLKDTIEQTRRDGINVVAAAGNDGDDRVGYPARVDEILAVGAAERGGGLCGFSNHGEGLDLRAPGCGLDTADPRSGEETTGNGTSHASAIVAATVAALRTYDEDIDVDEAEDLVLETTDDDNLDIEAAFRRAGLYEVVDAGEDNVPMRDRGEDGDGDREGHGSNGRGESGGGSGGGGGSDSGGGDAGDAVPLGPAPAALPTLPTPSFAYTVRRGVLHLKVRNRPPGVRVVVTLYRGGGEFGARVVRQIELRGAVLRRRVPRFVRVSVSFSAPGKHTSETVRRRTKE